MAGAHTRVGRGGEAVERSAPPTKTEQDLDRDSDTASSGTEEADQDEWEDIDGDCSTPSTTAHRTVPISKGAQPSASHKSKNVPTPFHFVPPTMTDSGGWGDDSLTGFYRSAGEERYRCKATTFSWQRQEEDAGGPHKARHEAGNAKAGAPSIPAYTLPPHLKVLRISVEAGIAGDPTALLEAYMRTLSVIASERKKTGSDGGRSGGRGLSEVVVNVPLPSSSASHEESPKSGAPRDFQHPKKGPSQGGSGSGTQRCLVSYQAPLGDEIHIGQSPRDTQLLGHQRFLGTLHFSAALPPPPSAALEGKQDPVKKGKADDGTESPENDINQVGRLPSYSKRFGEEQGVPAWQKEPSFMTWHRVKPYGSVDVCSARRECRMDEEEEEEEEVDACGNRSRTAGPAAGAVTTREAGLLSRGGAVEHAEKKKAKKASDGRSEDRQGGEAGEGEVDHTRQEKKEGVPIEQRETENLEEKKKKKKKSEQKVKMEEGEGWG